MSWPKTSILLTTYTHRNRKCEKLGQALKNHNPQYLSLFFQNISCFLNYSAGSNLLSIVSIPVLPSASMVCISPRGRNALFQASWWEMTDPESPPCSPSHRSGAQNCRLSQSPQKQNVNCLSKFAFAGRVKHFFLEGVGDKLQVTVQSRKQRKAYEQNLTFVFIFSVSLLFRISKTIQPL